MVGVVEVEVAFDRAGGVGAGVRVGAGAVVVFLDFRGDSGGAGEHVFGRSSGAGGVVIVDVDARALAVGFDEALALVVVDEACDIALVGDAEEAVVFVPEVGPSVAVGVVGVA